MLSYYISLYICKTLCTAQVQYYITRYTIPCRGKQYFTTPIFDMKNVPIYPFAALASIR